MASRNARSPSAASDVHAVELVAPPTCVNAQDVERRLREARRLAAVLLAEAVLVRARMRLRA
jgi:hypothetical protein